MKLILKNLLLPLLFLLSSSCSLASLDNDRVTTVTVVRHAEKLKGRDPSLSIEGKRRARRLAARFSNLSGVYSSNFNRTIETATPSAARFSLIIESSIGPMNFKALKADILANHKGQNVLVVGHSNTVPAFVNSLFKSKKVERISENDFSNLFTIQIKDSAAVSFKKEVY